MGRGDFVDGGGGGGCRGVDLRGIGGHLSGQGFGDGRIDGGESFRGSDILGVDRQDGFELGLGSLQVAFVAGLERLSEELRLARGGVAIFSDKGSGSEGESEGYPGELRTVDVFHGVGALKLFLGGGCLAGGRNGGLRLGSGRRRSRYGNRLRICNQLLRPLGVRSE